MIDSEHVGKDAAPSIDTMRGQREVPGRRPQRPNRDAGVREMGAVRKPATDLDPVTQGQVVRLHDLGASVVGMPPRCDVPVTDELGVHHGDHGSVPPPAPRPRRPDRHVRTGDRGAAVGGHLEQVDREFEHGVAGCGRCRPEGAGEIAARHHHRRRFVLQQSHDIGIGRGDMHVSRRSHGAAPLAATPDRHAPPTSAGAELSATTPRNAASAAAAAARRVPGDGAINASWRSRSINCLTARTKSPPVSSSSPTTSAKFPDILTTPFIFISPTSGKALSKAKPG